MGGKREIQTCKTFLPAAKPAGLWMIFGLSFRPDLVKYSHIEAGEAREHRLLRPMNKNLRSEVS